MLVLLLLYSLGDLQALNKANNSPIPEAKILNWTVQLCLAMKYIHSRKIVHRDIKCQNVFLTSKGTIKLGDFGISKHLGTWSFAETSLGTPYYLAPEVCAGRNYDYKADIWMLGCFVYELCSNKKPFEGESLHSIIVNIMEKSYKPLIGYSNTIQVIIERMLQKDPNKRASVEELLENPALKDIAPEILKQEEYKYLNEDNNKFTPHEEEKTTIAKHLIETRKNALTINTSFDNSSESKGQINTKQGTLPRHFIFSDHLLNPQAAYSPNRAILLAEFLKDKLGEEAFNSVCNILKESTNPLSLIDNKPQVLLKVIGSENAQCLQAFKYIMSSNVLYKPLQQVEYTPYNSKAWSMRRSDGSIKCSRMIYYQQKPLSTRAQAVAGLKTTSTAKISSLNVQLQMYQ